MLSVPSNADVEAFERAAYVDALRTANAPSFEAW
jgi:hypothetical protein